MYIQNVVGELLYIGTVAEKNRSSGRWKVGYKKTLRKHMIALNELQKCLDSSDIEVSCNRIKKFIEVCEANHEIGECYPPFINKKIDGAVIGQKCESVNQLISEIFADLLAEMGKTRINKRQVHQLLCALHNLPRVYLGRNVGTICNSRHSAIPETWALKYAAMNMNDEMKMRYMSKRECEYQRIAVITDNVDEYLKYYMQQLFLDGVLQADEIRTLACYKAQGAEYIQCSFDDSSADYKAGYVILYFWKPAVEKDTMVYVENNKFYDCLFSIIDEYLKKEPQMQDKLIGYMYQIKKVL